MMRCVRYLAISCILLVLVLSQCTSNTIHLWNGKDFTGWEFVLTNDDIDSNEVWSINNGVIYCRGVPNGYMRTESDYSTTSYLSNGAGQKMKATVAYYSMHKNLTKFGRDALNVN